MNKQLVASLSILVLLIGITSATGVHYAAAKGMPIHNPNWARIVSDPTSQDGHAPAYVGSSAKVIEPAKTIVQKNKDTSTAQDNVKTKPQVQKTNRDDQAKSDAAKIASDKAKANALIKANTHNSDIKVNQKPIK